MRPFLRVQCLSDRRGDSRIARFGLLLFWAEMEGFDLHFHPFGDENYGVAAIELAASGCSPGIRI